MILYFSATGNTKFVATELARLLDDHSVDLRERIRSHDYSPIVSKKPFVICSPIYVSEPPSFLIEFLRKTRLSGNPRVYFISTSAGSSGISDFMLRCLMRRKRYMGSADFTMPGNYIASNIFRAPRTEEIEQKISRARQDIYETADLIRSGRSLESRHVLLLEILITLPFVPVWYHLCQGVKGFHATESCISCGKCERLCPLQVISMQDGRPVWNGKSCAHCMSCIQNCPVDAIEYGKATAGKKRYLFEKYRYVVE